MGTTTRLLMAAILVAVIHGGVYVLSGAGMQLEARPPKHDLGELPTRIGPWTGEEVPRDPDLSPADAHDTVTRIYRNPSGGTVTLSGSVWVEYGRELPHRPENCYSNAGYQILGQKSIRLEVADQASTPLRLLFLDRHGERKCVLYWYQLGGEILARNYWARRTSWAIRRGEKPRPLVKVMLEVPASDPEKAEDELRSIAIPLIAWTSRL